MFWSNLLSHSNWNSIQRSIQVNMNIREKQDIPGSQTQSSDMLLSSCSDSSWIQDNIFIYFPDFSLNVP